MIHSWFSKKLEFHDIVYNVVDIDVGKMCKYMLATLATTWRIYFKDLQIW